MLRTKWREFINEFISFIGSSILWHSPEPSHNIVSCIFFIDVQLISIGSSLFKVCKKSFWIFSRFWCFFLLWFCFWFILMSFYVAIQNCSARNDLIFYPNPISTNKIKFFLQILRNFFRIFCIFKINDLKNHITPLTLLKLVDRAEYNVNTSAVRRCVWTLPRENPIASLKTIYANIVIYIW